MKLRYDPFQVFRAGKSPAALYARQKWLGEADTLDWKRDFEQTVSNLLAGQEDAGSWGHSLLQTIQHLFGLHLTIRDATAPVQKGLDWLMDRISSARNNRPIPHEELDAGALSSLPFSKGRTDLLACGATLFLCTIFGREKDPKVLSAYERLLNNVRLREEGRWCGWSCSNNILRAFVVHPRYSRIPEIKKAVDALATVQDASGRWRGQIPFYQTINALAHLDSKDVLPQLTLAFKRLGQIQNRDGTWGRTDREWNTFLTLHALKNKKQLTLPDSRHEA
jgi:hypothetical protein